MTVASTTRKQTFAGAQSALTFSFRTLASHPEFIKVKNTVIATGVETDLTYNVDYTVALEADGTGGIVTISPTFSSSYNHTVYRQTADLQESDYDDFNQFPADTIENDIDRRTLISQENSEATSRVPTLPISYTGGALGFPLPLDGYSLAWSGGVLVNTNLTGSTGSTGPTGPSGATGTISSVSSSTSEITVVSTSTTPIITAVNGFTGGAGVLLRLDSSGRLPALDGRNLSSITASTNANNSGKQFGSWASATFATSYLAATDLIVCAVAHGPSCDIVGYTDAANPPTTIRVDHACPNAVDFPGCITLPVRKGDYWKVTHSGTASSLYFLPMGS